MELGKKIRQLRFKAGLTQEQLAQRVGTIMDANRIIVMDDGKIVGIGTHDELMEKCPLYNSIASMQFSEVC